MTRAERKLAKAEGRVGLPQFHVHQLRHTFACRWVERGGSLAGLQAILGHASVTTTQRYEQPLQRYVREEAARIMVGALDNFFAGSAGEHSGEQAVVDQWQGR